jgi:hypothetical protein
VFEPKVEADHLFDRNRRGMEFIHSQAGRRQNALRRCCVGTAVTAIGITKAILDFEQRDVEIPADWSQATNML